MDRHGQGVYADPVEIKCRWEEKMVEFRDRTGATRISQAVVLVDRDMSVGDLLWLGAIADAPVAPTTTTYEILNYGKVPEVKGRKFVRTAMF